MSNTTTRKIPAQLGGDTRTTVQLAGLSAWDPIHLGIDEYGEPLRKSLVNRCLLAGGLMGTGKSGLLSLIIGHASQCTDCRIVGIDGKKVELELWKGILDYVVGKDIHHALHTLDKLITIMDRRYDALAHKRNRKIERGDGTDLIFLIIDELMMFTSVLGDTRDQEAFTNKLMELVALGRAVGIIVIAATQRPAAVVVPPKLRDLFGYRAAFRCSNPVSSNVILGDQWDEQGYDASKLDMNYPGIGYFLAEEGHPFPFRSAWLEDHEITNLEQRGISIRNTHHRTEMRLAA